MYTYEKRIFFVKINLISICSVKFNEINGANSFKCDPSKHYYIGA